MARKTPKKQKAVKFLRGWQGRLAGSISTTLTPGIMSTLVTANIAEWHPINPGRKQKSAERNIQNNK